MTGNLLLSHSASSTLRYGKEVAQRLEVGRVVGLIGPLGAGKTVMIKGMCKALGYDGIVTSPSFSLINIYSGRIMLYHFDCYRLEGIHDLEDIGYEEYFYSNDGICLVEWADRVEDALPKNATLIHLEIVSENERRITIEQH